MTRKEALERQHQQSLQANGYATPQRSLDEGPKGTPPSARASVVKKTITLGVVLALLWLAYRIGTTMWNASPKDRAPAAEERSK